MKSYVIEREKVCFWPPPPSLTDQIWKILAKWRKWKNCEKLESFRNLGKKFEKTAYKIFRGNWFALRFQKKCFGTQFVLLRPIFHFCPRTQDVWMEVTILRVYIFICHLTSGLKNLCWQSGKCMPICSKVRNTADRYK